MKIPWLLFRPLDASKISEQVYLRDHIGSTFFHVSKRQPNCILEVTPSRGFQVQPAIFAVTRFVSLLSAFSMTGPLEWKKRLLLFPVRNASSAGKLNAWWLPHNIWRTMFAHCIYGLPLEQYLCFDSAKPVLSKNQNRRQLTLHKISQSLYP